MWYDRMDTKVIFLSFSMEFYFYILVINVVGDCPHSRIMITLKEVSIVKEKLLFF
jgi:hypothetical protein